MKKTTLCLAVLGLAACATTTGVGNGLTRLESEPTNCEFLYNLDSSVTTYRLMDVYESVEKMILEQPKLGDSYYISNEDIVENVGAVFGPEHTHKFKVKVYNCNK